MEEIPWPDVQASLMRRFSHRFPRPALEGMSLDAEEVDFDPAHRRVVDEG
jgi:hypothetical protein